MKENFKMQTIYLLRKRKDQLFIIVDAKLMYDESVYSNKGIRLGQDMKLDPPTDSMSLPLSLPPSLPNLPASCA